MEDVQFPSDQNTKRMASSSHQVIWVLFQYWLKTPAAADFVARTVHLRGVSLDGWMQKRPVAVTFQPVLAMLMERWGVDVARFSKDRELRNQVSYNPNRIMMESTGATAAWVSDIYRQAWMLLEPGTGNAFENLDQYIFRDTANSLARLDSKSARDELKRRGVTINQAWASAVLGESGRSLVHFLDATPTSVPADLLGAAGKDLSAGTLREQLTGMLGRALILLRFATGAARDLMTEAGCSADDVDFWVVDLLTLHGIRPPSGPPRDYAGLYADVADVLDDLLELDGLEDPADFAAVGEELGAGLHVLSGFERVTAWAVA